MKTTYIYGVKDLEIDRFIYVGKSNEPGDRYGKLSHHHNECVQKFVEEKGEDNFRVEELEEVKFKVSRDWIEQEEFWITKFRKEGHPLCNKNDGGGGPTEQTKEIKAKQSERMTGENNPMYGKRGKASPNYGSHRTEETKAKISITLSGENHPLYGKRGKDSPNYGSRHTEETKAKIGKANSNPSEETRIKLRKAAAKPYPAFFNVKTKQYIPAGINLTKLCLDQQVSYWVLSSLKLGHTKQSRDSWRLAKKGDV